MLDYVSVSENITFDSGGDSVHSVSVNITDDVLMEGAEEFTIILTGTPQVRLVDSEATVSIQDNDSEK